MPKENTSFKAGDVIWIRPGTPSAVWMSTLGPLLVVRPDWSGIAESPEVTLMDGSDPTSSRGRDGRFTAWKPHVINEDIYRDEFLTAVRRVKVSQK